MRADTGEKGVYKRCNGTGRKDRSHTQCLPPVLYVRFSHFAGVFQEQFQYVHFFRCVLLVFGEAKYTPIE